MSGKHYCTEAEAIAAWNTRVTHGTLTAEQVREIMEDNSRQYQSPTDQYVYLTKYDWQAIADELNAMMGNGTCEMEYVSDFMSWHCKACDMMDMASRDPKPRFCKWCGRKVSE